MAPGGGAHGTYRTYGATDDEISYLRRNLEHVRSRSRLLKQQVVGLEGRLRGSEEVALKYKALYARAHGGQIGSGNGEMEISSLHQQLDAVILLKDALNTENIELQRRIEVAERARAEHANAESERRVCVVCMDNLSNIVCLPCKHLALCSLCSQKQSVGSCPICRRDIDEKMQIFVP